MAHDYRSSISSIGRARTITLTLFALILVLTAAVASGFAFDKHGRSKLSDPARREQSYPAAITNQDQTNVPDQAPPGTNAEKADPLPGETTVPGTSPGQSNSSSSSTTITVNGQTVKVEGSGSVERSYISDDGSNRVNISINNSQSTHGSSNNKEDKKQR